MQDYIPTIACPCGYQHRLVPPPGDGFVVIRDKDWFNVLDTEVACREISGSWSPMVPDSNPRHKEHTELTWKIVERCGSLLECPQCGRLLWRRAGKKDGPRFHVFVPETTKS